MTDVIIIGGGPAGLTAAIYAARAGKSVLVIEEGAFGGQISNSHRVENYPGIPSVSGAALADSFVSQALGLGVQVELGKVVSLADMGEMKLLKTEDGEYTARAVIIATGAKPRALGLPGEDELVGNGISFCAMCDGAFFKEKAIAVAGGGNTALHEALHLADVCGKVYIIHRRDSFRAEARLIWHVKAKQNVEFCLGEKIVGFEGKPRLTGVILENKQGEKHTLPVECLFVAVGRTPDNGAFAGYMELDKDGFALSGEDCTTRTAGIFVAGDCRAKKVRQLVTACGDGAVAATAACAYVDYLKHK